MKIKEENRKQEEIRKLEGDGEYPIDTFTQLDALQSDSYNASYRSVPVLHAICYLCCPPSHRLSKILLQAKMLARVL